MTATIEIRPDGPLAVTGVERIVGSNGKDVVHAELTVKLCRCGGSMNKPFCDGAHKRNGFTGARVSDGSKDKPGSYPSGALSYSVDGTERAPEQWTPSITVTKDGPYAVLGVELLGVAFAQGVPAERYTLCRCGASKNKPFCDGSHHEVGFTAL